jgi:hypothetical protein
MYTSFFVHTNPGNIIQVSKKLITSVSQSSVRMIFCNKQSGITAITDLHFYEATLNCPYGQFYLNNVCTACS